LRRTRGIVATTVLDRQGDKLSVGALKDMARQISEWYIPMMFDHDIRYPPIGRAAGAEVVELQGGEHALEVMSEVFEKGDSVESLAGDGRRMRVRSESPDRFVVYYDRGLAGPEGADLLEQLHGLAPVDPRPSEYGKKSLEPLPTLLILAGTFVVGSIATGFLTKLGEDVYEGLRDSLTEHWRGGRPRPEVLDLCFCATRGGQPLEVHVLLTRPSARDIERLFNAALKELDSLLATLPLENHDVARIVVRYDGKAPAVSYEVRGDCVPLPLTLAAEKRPRPG